MSDDTIKLALIKALRGKRNLPLPDEDEAWRDLKKVVNLYRASESVRRTRIANPRQRCQEIAVTLKIARREIENALDNPALSLALLRPEFKDDRYVFAIDRDVLTTLLHALGTLEENARKSAKTIQRHDGSRVLPLEVIVDLAYVYHRHTGLKPGAGGGAFTQFICSFVNAMGKAISKHTVIDYIKDARRDQQRWLFSMFARSSDGFRPSPFAAD